MRGFRVAGQRHVAFEHLADELLDHVLAALQGGRVPVEPALRHDLVEQRLSSESSVVSRPAAATGCCWAAHCLHLPAVPSSACSLSRVLRIRDRVEQRLVELVVALQAAAQIGEPRPQIQQLLERLDLLGHVLRREVVQAFEVEIRP